MNMTLFGEPLHTSAALSSCGSYRYELTRRWSDRPLVGWVMLNPSTAVADTDDPTIRRCIGYAQAWGFGGIIVRNLYALRATNPAELDFHPAPIGPDNHRYLSRCADNALTVVAWGARGRDRGRRVLEQLTRQGARPHQLAKTNDGQPRHPLYLPGDLTPEPVTHSASAG